MQRTYTIKLRRVQTVELVFKVENAQLLAKEGEPDRDDARALRQLGRYALEYSDNVDLDWEDEGLSVDDLERNTSRNPFVDDRLEAVRNNKGSRREWLWFKSAPHAGFHGVASS